ncbi:MAG: SIR2 family NAD-dependent protein deacylase [Actinomycetes bacterium]
MSDNLEPEPSDERGGGEGDAPPVDAAAFARARTLVQSATSITVLTGAGISTDSGIPDFRGPDGVWTLSPDAEMMSNIETYLAEEDVRRRAWRHRATSEMWTAVPNPGHDAVVALERQGRLRCVVTQNIDGLHHAAGTHPELIVEVHGSVRDGVCTDCDYQVPIEVVLERVRGGDDDPRCPTCGGILKSSTVLFGEQLPHGAMRQAFDALVNSDLLIAVGTTLTVFPVASLVPEAVRGGVPVVIVNGGPTDMDDIVDVVVRGSISEVLGQLVT